VQADYPRLVGGLAAICGSRAAAEDAVQEALARAWERSERGERIESLKAWVTTVSLNLTKSGLRKLRAERRAAQRLKT
jgi:RNA polymerase sigma-70 factor (ECF subfamily)